MPRRAILLLTVFIMVLNYIPEGSVFAHNIDNEKILYFCENFETNSDSMRVKSMVFSPYDNEIMIKKDEKALKSVCIKMNGAAQPKGATVYRRFVNVRPSGNVIIEADIMFKSFGGCTSRIAVRSPESADKEVYLITVSGSGRVTAADGREILSSMHEGQFYKIAFSLNLTDGIYDIFIDGEEKATGIDFRANLTYGFSEISMLLFNTRDVSSGCRTEYNIDNIKAYGASKPLKTSEFDAVNWTIPKDFDSIVSEQMVKCSSKNIIAYYAGAENALVFGEYHTVSEGFPNDIEGASDMHVSQDKSGLVIMSPADYYIDWEENGAYLSALTGMLNYERPRGDDVLKRISESFPNKAHPRLMADGSTFESVKNEINNNSVKASWYRDIKDRADAYLSQPLATFTKTVSETTSFINQGTSFKEMAPCLAFVYHIENDRRYADRLISELEQWINQPVWAPYSMLGLGRAVNGMAFAYDWLYDVISEETKTALRQAISERFFSEVIKDYYNIEPRSRSYRWSLRRTGDNWNTTINSAVIMAAVIMGDEEEYKTECSMLLNEAMYSAESAFDQLAPDGAWFEGVAYWTPTVEAMVWIMETLRNVTGSDYGFFNVPGMKFAGYYLYEMSGAAGIFNFNFAAERGYPRPSLLYFAHRLKDPSLMQLCIDHYAKYRGEEDLYMTADALILSGDIPAQRAEINLPLDAYYRGAEAVSMRSSWDENKMVYAGFHSGYNGAQNAQLDIGTFVVEAFGDRFITDFGPERYSLMDNVGNIFKAYMNRAEGANCYIINPSENFYDQELNASCRMNRFESNDTSALAISDISAAYGAKVISAVRGIKMTNNRSAIVLQDEINCKSPSDIYWGMHTPADVSLSDDGKTAILNIGGNKMEVKILSESGKFRRDKAQPLPECYQLEGQTEHPDVTKLAMRFENAEKVNITLCFTPLGFSGSTVNNYPIVQKIADWTLDMPGADEPFENENYFGASETVFDFDDLCSSDNGVFVNNDSSKYQVIGRTPFQNDSLPYNDVFVTGNGDDKYVTLKSTKKENLAFGVKNFEYRGCVEIGARITINDLNAYRHFGVYDCWRGGDRPWFFLVNRNGYLYACGKELSSSLRARPGDVFDCTFYLNLDTGFTRFVIGRNGKTWIKGTNYYDALKKYIAVNKTLSSLYLYQREYAGSGLTPAVVNLNDCCIKPSERFYDEGEKIFNFNTYEGSADGVNGMPADFTLAHGLPKDGASSYEGIFSVLTDRGTSIKAESTFKRTGEAVEAPFIYTPVSLKSDETGALDFSVMRPVNSAALYINFGESSKSLMLVSNRGRMYVFDEDTGIDLPDTDTWYDIKLQYNTAKLAAHILVYSGGELFGSSFIKRTSGGGNALENVKGTDVTAIGIGLYCKDVINQNAGDVSSAIFDDIRINKTEPLHIPSAEENEIFDIAYSSPHTSSCVPVPKYISVTFNNRINTSGFGEKSVYINGAEVPPGQIEFDADCRTVILHPEGLPAGRCYVLFKNIEDLYGNTLTDYIVFDTLPYEIVFGNVNFKIVESGFHKKLYADFSARTKGGFGKKMLYMLALYEAQSPERLVYAKTARLNIGGAETEFGLFLDIPNDGKSYTAKAYRWGDDFSPLTDTARLSDIDVGGD